jgi:hypothetical protein
LRRRIRTAGYPVLSKNAILPERRNPFYFQRSGIL